MRPTAPTARRTAAHATNIQNSSTPPPINAGSVAEGLVGTRAAERGQRLLVQTPAIPGEAAKDDAIDERRLRQRIGRGCDRNLGVAIGGKSIHAGGDGGRGDRGETLRPTQLYGAAVAGREQPIPLLISAPPDRPRRMD